MSRPAQPAIAVFGGTFDPVHYGHLRPALEVAEALAPARVYMVPSARPPHREAPVAAPHHRLAMLERAIDGQRLLCADDRELRREGPSYMVETLSELRSEHPRAPLILVLGQDAANGLDGWHRWRELFELAHIVVMRRPASVANYGRELSTSFQQHPARAAEELLAVSAGLTLTMPVSQLGISASDIRERVLAGRSIEYLTPPAVVHYIAENGLYAALPPA